MPRRRLRQTPLLPYQSPKIAARAILENKVDVSFRFLREGEQEERGNKGWTSIDMSVQAALVLFWGGSQHQALEANAALPGVSLRQI